jgi:hypothetical protein
MSWESWGGGRSTTGRSGWISRGLGCGVVDLFPRVTFAIVTAVGRLVTRRVPEGVAVVVEGRGGAVPLLARSRLIGSRAHSFGDRCRRVAADVVDAALAGLAVAVVEFDLCRG